MWFVLKVILILVVLYLLAGAIIGLRNAKELDANLQRVKDEQQGNAGYVRGYVAGVLLSSFIAGPWIYTKVFIKSLLL